MRRGRQNFELKLFGCKNVPYVGQINVRRWDKIFGVQNSGDPFFVFLFLGDSENFVLCRGAKNFSRGAPNGKHG